MKAHSKNKPCYGGTEAIRLLSTWSFLTSSQESLFLVTYLINELILCICLGLCVPHTFTSSWWPTDCPIPRTRVAGDYKAPCGCWEMEPIPLLEEPTQPMQSTQPTQPPQPMYPMLLPCLAITLALLSSLE